MNALHPPYRTLHLLWMNMALNFHAQAEVMLSHRPNEHPITANRLSYSDLLCKTPLKHVEGYTQHLETLGKRFIDIERKNEELQAKSAPPVLSRYSREELLEMLDRLNGELKPQGYDLGEAIRTEAKPWTTLLDPEENPAP